MLITGGLSKKQAIRMASKFGVSMSDIIKHMEKESHCLKWLFKTMNVKCDASGRGYSSSFTFLNSLEITN